MCFCRSIFAEKSSKFSDVSFKYLKYKKMINRQISGHINVKEDDSNRMNLAHCFKPGLIF